MRFVQFSDIHLSKSNLYALENYYLPALQKDLETFNCKAPIDLIFITGDLVDKGGNSFEEAEKSYEIFSKNFIEPLKTKLNLTNSNFLFIPGNHDVDQNQIDDIYETGLKAVISTTDSANNKLNDLRNSFTSINNRIKRFKEFERAFHSNTSNYLYSNNESTFIFERGSHKIGVLLINDSWRVSPTLEVKHHFIGINQFLNAKKYFEEKHTDFNLVLLHHPIALLNEEEREQINQIIQKFDFELVLFGHSHKFNLTQNFGVNGNSIFINSKSAFNNPDESIAQYQPGYNIIDIDLNSLNLKCFFRKYISNRYEFDADVDAAPGGFYETKIVPKGDKKNFYQVYELANKTVSSHID